MLALILRHRRLAPLTAKVLRWHRDFHLYRRPRPLAAGMYITNGCNLRCRSCNIWRKRPTRTVPRARALQLVGALGRSGCYYFSISGGEPLLVPHLADTVAAARQAGIDYVHLVSNGMLLDGTAVRNLAAAGLSEISLSLDGPPAAHDRRRGHTGAYAAVLAALANLQRWAPDMPIVLNTILAPARPADALHAVAVAERLGLAVKVQPFVLHPGFDLEGRTAEDERRLADGDRHPLREALARLRRSPAVVNSVPFLTALEAYFFDRRRLPLADEPCLFGYHHVEIDEAGRLHPCLEGDRWRDGFVLDRDLGEVLNSRDYRARVEGLKACTGCRENMYVCYYEPRLNFPIWNLVRHRWVKRT